MKKNLLPLLTLFLVFLNVSFAQTDQYHPFEENVAWRFDLQTNVPLPPHCNGAYAFHYYFQGDTLINSITYKKLHRSHVDYAPSTVTSCFPFTSYFQGYAGAIRDDSVSNQVFYHALFYPDFDTLLFDYNLQVGDTLSTYLVGCETVINSIDSVQINGSYRKRWWYAACDFPSENIYFIQGYGGSHGLIEWYDEFQRAKLICIKEDDQITYETGENSNFGCNDVYADVSEKFLTDIELYPVPTSTNLKIRGLEAYSFDVQIFDPMGNTVYFERYDSNLDVSRLSNGIYFVRIRFGEQDIIKRILIEN